MIKIYKDSNAGAIFLEDNLGAQFLNSLQAVVEDPNSTKVSIFDKVRSVFIIKNAEFSNFVNENGVAWGADQIETANNLNAIFTATGTATGNAPVITSNLLPDLQQGDTLNYELTANFGVAYEWDLSNVAGDITTVEGNVRKLIGGSNLPIGTYSIPVKATNYNGEDSKVITLTVDPPAFTNTKSTVFQNNDWLQGNAGVLQNVLGRTGNGLGSSDAWTISLWFKAGTATNASQTILYFGAQDIVNNGSIQLKYNGSLNRLEFRYGSNNNRLNFATQNNTLPVGVWKHILITYDGGTTGSASASVNNYYSRFNFYIDGVSVNTVNSNNNFGYSSSVLPQNFRIGRFNSAQHLRNSCKIDEMSIWNSDQSANANTIYNSGTPSDLDLLGAPALHWWRMGDNDSFPFIFDIGTAANLILQMLSMNAASFDSDTP